MNTIVPEGYKQTKVGVIPEDWEVVKLGEVLNEKPKYGINARAVEYSNSLPTYIRITDIDTDGNFNPDKKVSVDNKDYRSFILKENEIVFARTGATVGKSYLYNKKDGELVYAGFLIKVAPNIEKLNSVFLKNFTDTSQYWKWIQLMSARSGQPGVSGNEYSIMPIPLPSLKEQEKIAEILTTWDETITKQEELIKAKELQKKGLMQKLLSGEVRFSGFSGEWETFEFEEIFERVPSKKYQINSNEYQEFGKYPVIDQGKKLIIAYSNNEEKLYKNSSIIVFGDHTRELKYIDFDFIIGADGTQLIKTKDMFDNKFFYYNLLIKNIPNTGYNRHFKFLLEMNFDTPSLPEQQKIAEVLSLADDEINLLQNELAELKQQKKGLMQKLLTGKVRVKV